MKRETHSVTLFRVNMQEPHPSLSAKTVRLRNWGKMSAEVTMTSVLAFETIKSAGCQVMRK